ncbi:MAG TPA: sulfatase-like hydrolase/transferase [Rubrivivax sp.]|nr:sulfatase-like hydrolase/transferase [Rubrivivax sp.]
MPSTFGGVIPTPTMDRLAKDGLRYNRVFSTALCSPTRAALITGRNRVYALCREAFARAEADVRSVTRTSIDAGFANDDVKAGLREALSRWQRGLSGASA